MQLAAATTIFMDYVLTSVHCACAIVGSWLALEHVLLIARAEGPYAICQMSHCEIERPQLKSQTSAVERAQRGTGTVRYVTASKQSQRKASCSQHRQQAASRG